MERVTVGILGFGLAFLVLWLPLAAVLRAMPRFLDVTLHPWGEHLAKTAAVAAVAVALGYVPLVGWMLGIIAAAVLLQRWFDADLSATAVALVVIAGLRWIAAAAAFGLLA
jgi:hypothetical protein